MISPQYTKEPLAVLARIRDIQGTNAKISELSKYRGNREIRMLLEMAYSPFYITGIAKKKIAKNSFQGSMWSDSKIILNIEELYLYFKKCNTGRESDVCAYIQFRDKFAYLNGGQTFSDMLDDIMSKTLVIGLAAKNINKALGVELIPRFGCMLGSKIEDSKDIHTKRIAITEKLDGNRCIVVHRNAEALAFSRTGKPIDGIEHILYEIKGLPYGIYDGELLADTFSATQSALRTKGKKYNLIFHIFDYINDTHMDSFFDSACKEIGETYGMRRELLDIIMNDHDTQYCKLVPVLYHGEYDEGEIHGWHHELTEKGGEGVMVNNIDARYIKDRTKELLKVKSMHTLDLEVISIEEGGGEFKGMLGAAQVRYKDTTVGVGSGWKKAEREKYFNFPDLLIGKIIEVQYFEECSDKEGSQSLRFPVFKGVRNDKDNADY